MLDISDASAGTKNLCPICATQSTFLEFRGRKAEQCPHCRSLVRTRCMYLCLMIKGHLRTPPDAKFSKRVHHFAPEKSLFDALSAGGTNRNYRCYDFFPDIYRFARHFVSKHDLSDSAANTALPRADVVIHNHVLEHLPGDFSKTLRDLNSIVAPGGIHAFTIPHRNGKFDEDLSPSLTEDERIRRFAQSDHMRIFGTEDSVSMLRNIFDRQDIVFRISKHLTSHVAEIFGVGASFRADSFGKVDGNTVFFYENT